MVYAKIIEYFCPQIVLFKKKCKSTPWVRLRKKISKANPIIAPTQPKADKIKHGKIKHIDNKHDALFGQAFSDRDNIEGFVKEYLDAELLEHLDLETLELMPDTFVEEGLLHIIEKTVLLCVQNGF